MRYMRNEEFRLLGSMGVVLSIFILLLMTVYIVPAGHRGVLLTFGKPDLIEKDEGLGFKVPIAQKVVKMNVQTLKYEVDASSASHDLQIVHTQLAVNFHLDDTMAAEIYQELSVNYQGRIIQPAVQEVVKSVTATYTAEELITERPRVKDDITLQLKERLAPRGIIVEEISMTDFDFSESFNEAIEAKVTAEQLKLKAERDLERIIIEKEQQIKQAEAQAEALRLQKQEVTQELIRLREMENQRAAIEKWDGVLPKVTGGAMPFIDVTAQMGE